MVSNCQPQLHLTSFQIWTCISEINAAQTNYTRLVTARVVSFRVHLPPDARARDLKCTQGRAGDFAHQIRKTVDRHKWEHGQRPETRRRQRPGNCSNFSSPVGRLCCIRMMEQRNWCLYTVPKPSTCHFETLSHHHVKNAPSVVFSSFESYGSVRLTSGPWVGSSARRFAPKVVCLPRHGLSTQRVSKRESAEYIVQ